MRLIRKSKEPKELLEYRLLPGATFDGLPSMVKSAIRKALVRDQGGLCCYCMRRIHDDDDKERKQLEQQQVSQVRIEHWKPQSKHAALQLAWLNLFAACNGNEGSSPNDQTCDVRKGDCDMTLDPLLPKHIASLHYCESASNAEHPQHKQKGLEIGSTNPDIQQDLEHVLNLNHATLRRNRKEAMRAMIDGLIRVTRKTLGAPGQFPNALLRSELSRCTEFDSKGRLPPFAGALAYWLEKRLGGLEKAT
jgi:uncharacterized protein (TIGR02646 family)